jgi:anti-anti-sigma factor
VWITRDALGVNVIVSGEVDIATAPKLYAALNGGRTRDAASVVIDLRAVTFMDSTGLRVLLTAREAGRAPACRSESGLRALVRDRRGH